MIRRGSFSSRLLAVTLAAAPLIVGLGLFAGWAYEGLVVDGVRAEQALGDSRRLEAMAEQARQYEPLGEAWRDYVASEAAGAVRALTSADAAADTRERLHTLFERFGGGLSAAETVQSAPHSGALSTVTLDVLGAVPTERLAGFLEALETEPPFLFIETLDLWPEADGAQSELHLRLELFVIEGPRQTAASPIAAEAAR